MLFVILCRSRTGSNWLGSLLNSHTDIFCLGEIFRPKCWLKRYLQLVLLFLVKIPKPRMVVGFKLFYYHKIFGMPLEKGWGFLMKHDVAIVHLIRRDILSVICSRERALKTNDWYKKSTQDSRRSFDPIELDIVQVKREIRETLEFVDLARKYFRKGRYIEVSYEDLVIDRTVQLKRIQNFLGVCPTDLVSNLVKQNVKPSFEDITNIIEVINATEEFKANSDFKAPEL